MSLASSLFDANSHLVEAALGSPFVSRLADRSLPLTSFRSYIAQDAFFLDAFARAYALALAHSDDPESLADFASLISGVVGELRMHAGYAARWGVHPVSIEPLPATREYTDFLMATADGQSTWVTCAAMAPCMRLYSHIGGQLASRVDAGNAYAEWVHTYASEEFEALAAKLEGLLDRHASNTSEVRSAYRRAMTLEVEFFAAFA